MLPLILLFFARKNEGNFTHWKSLPIFKPHPMPAESPRTISSYIKDAPSEGQEHLKKLYQILKEIAPDAEETIKWNVPFFIEPRFLFSFSAFKAHLAFVPGPETLAHFQEERPEHQRTANFLKIRYRDPLPEDLIRKMAVYQLRRVRARTDDSFW